MFSVSSLRGVSCGGDIEIFCRHHQDYGPLAINSRPPRHCWLDRDTYPWIMDREVGGRRGGDEGLRSKPRRLSVW